MADRARRQRLASAEVVPSARGGRVSPTTVGGQTVWTHTTTQDWQTEVWQYIDAVPEAQQALNWLAAGSSRAVLFAAERLDNGEAGEPTDDPQVVGALSLLLDPLRQPEWLELAAYNMGAVGTFYLYGGEFDGEPGYRVVSTENVTQAGTKRITVRVDDGKPRTYKPGEETLTRIWKPFPRHPWQATSPLRSQRGVLRNIVKLSMLIDSVSDSRMRGAGLLLLSNRLSIPGGTPDKPAPTVAQELLRVASVALQDPDSAEAHVPITVEGDLDAAEKVAELINLGVDFPKLLQALLDQALVRFANGMPLPKGIILGDDANHWNEFHREDEAVKMAITPLVNLIASGLAQTWLPPMLRAVGLDPARWTLGVDMTAMEQRPDKSARAIELHDRAAISDEALRRETGFDDDDAPDPAEIQNRPRSPRAIEPPSDETAPPAGDGQGNPPPEQAGLLRQTNMQALEAAAQMAAVAALTRFGNKIRGASHRNRNLYAGQAAHLIALTAPAEDRASLNTDDWPDGVLEQFAAFAAQAGLNPECACFRLQARVAQVVRNGAALATLPLVDEWEACRSA